MAKLAVADDPKRTWAFIHLRPNTNATSHGSRRPVAGAS